MHTSAARSAEEQHGEFVSSSPETTEDHMLSLQRRTMSRQVSRTTSALSYKSAVSHLQEDGSLDGEHHCSQSGGSVDLDRCTHT